MASLIRKGRLGSPAPPSLWAPAWRSYDASCGAAFADNAMMDGAGIGYRVNQMGASEPASKRDVYLPSKWLERLEP